MPSLPDANKPFAPFYQPVPPPVPGPFDAPLVCVSINETWMTYILGACQVFLAASTWDSDDENVVKTTIENARALINALMDFIACPMPVQFRVNAAYPQNWQYSTDGAVTWQDGPDTASNYTPQFIADGAAPSGYDLTVNGNHSHTATPSFAQNDPNAVITDPASLFRNLITASGGAEGLAVQALAHIGVQLVTTNGVAMALNKIPGFGLATSALEVLAGGTDYTFNLLEMS